MSPAQEYSRRLEARRAAHVRLLALDARFAYARLAVFGAAAVLAWLAFWAGVLHPAWLVAPAAAFAVLMQRHDRVITARDAAGRAIS